MGKKIAAFRDYCRCFGGRKGVATFGIGTLVQRGGCQASVSARHHALPRNTRGKRLFTACPAYGRAAKCLANRARRGGCGIRATGSQDDTVNATQRLEERARFG